MSTEQFSGYCQGGQTTSDKDFCCLQYKDNVGSSSSTTAKRCSQATTDATCPFSMSDQRYAQEMTDVAIQYQFRLADTACHWLMTFARIVEAFFDA